MNDDNSNENEEMIDFGPEPDPTSKYTTQPISAKARLRLAKGFMATIALLYFLIAGLYVLGPFSETTAEPIKSVWNHFSQFSTNALMLVLGYYFAKN